jgi:AcrR family transcriptional regulator
MAYRQTDRVKQRLAARRDAIIAAARALAGEQGMEAVQIAPVAERAGIAAGTVYRYFPAKTALVEALVETVAQDEIAAMRDAAETAPGPLSALAAAMVTFTARARRQRRLIWALTTEPVDPDVDAARFGFRRALAAEIESRIATEQIAGVAPALAAPAALGALLEGLIGPLAPDAGVEAAEREAVQMLVLMALRGLGIVDARARGLVVNAAWPGSRTEPAADSSSAA